MARLRWSRPELPDTRRQRSLDVARQELFAPGGGFFLHPSQPAQLLQAGVKAIANQTQVVNVLHGILELPLRERPFPPVGAGFLLLRRLAQEFGNERAVAGRVLDAGQPGGKLHVEKPFRQPIDRLQTEFHFAAPGVYDGLVLAGDDRLPERPHVVYDHGVDHRQTLGRADLDQAEFGPVGMLGDELRVQRNPGARGKLPAILA